jgi:tetratricopeptide (TPR) repeat protein
LRRALDINPDHSEALLQYGSLTEALGNVGEGLRYKQQALERNPKSPLVLVQIAWSLWHQRDYDEAIRWVKRALEVDPRHLLAGEFLAGAYWKQGNFDALFAENIRRATAFGVSEEVLAHLTDACAEMQRIYATAGRRGLTAYMLGHMPKGENSAMFVQRAVLYGAAGEMDAAFEQLDRALALRDPALVYLAVGPQWDSLRNDRRFNERLTSMALPSGCAS